MLQKGLYVLITHFIKGNPFYFDLVFMIFRFVFEKEKRIHEFKRKACSLTFLSLFKEIRGHFFF